MTFAFDNSYAGLPERFYARLPATPVKAPKLIKVNRALAFELNLDADFLESAEGVAILAGNAVPAGGAPLAAAYAGHQFGAFVPQLGDGRAILLGEVIGRDGQRRDIQLKGAGPTPYSRSGDGRAALGPVLREYIVSEAMAALGIPIDLLICVDVAWPYPVAANVKSAAHLYRSKWRIYPARPLIPAAGSRSHVENIDLDEPNSPIKEWSMVHMNITSYRSVQEWLLERMLGRLQIGGTGVQAASTLTTLGFPTLVHLTGRSPEQIAALQTADMEEFTTTQIAAFTATQFSAFSTTNVGALNSTQIGALTTTQVGALTTAQLGALTTTQIAALSATNVTALADTQIQALSATQLARLGTDAVAAFDGTQVAALSTTQVRALTATQVGALDTVDVAEFTDTQIAALTAAQVQAWSTTVIGNLAGTKIAALDVTQIPSLTVTQLDYLSTTNIGAFNTTQLYAFTSTQIASLDAAQIEAYLGAV